MISFYVGVKECMRQRESFQTIDKGKNDATKVIINNINDNESEILKTEEDFKEN